MRRVIPTSLLALALVASACGNRPEAPASKDDSPALAEVGDDAITVSDLETQLNRQSPFLRTRYQDPEKQKELLENMVRFELLAQEAKRRGLDKDPEVQEAMKKVMVQKLVNEALEGPEAEVALADSKAWYQAHIDEFVKPERVRTAHLFIAAPQGDAAARKAAAAKAAQLRATLEAGRKDPRVFPKVVRENSDDAETRAVGGDLNYRTREELAGLYGEAFADAAFALEDVGAVSGVVETEDGFHVLRLTSRQKASSRSFDEVRRSVESRMRQENRKAQYDAFLDQLREKSGVTLHEDRLAEVQIEGAPSGHPATPAAEAPAAAEPTETAQPAE